jgi:hypothetical protein
VSQELRNRYRVLENGEHKLETATLEEIKSLIAKVKEIEITLKAQMKTREIWVKVVGMHLGQKEVR